MLFVVLRRWCSVCLQLNLHFLVYQHELPSLPPVFHQPGKEAIVYQCEFVKVNCQLELG